MFLKSNFIFIKGKFYLRTFLDASQVEYFFSSTQKPSLCNQLLVC